MTYIQRLNFVSNNLHIGVGMGGVDDFGALPSFLSNADNHHLGKSGIVLFLYRVRVQNHINKPRQDYVMQHPRLTHPIEVSKYLVA